MFKEFGVNYNNEPEIHKKGTIITKKCLKMVDRGLEPRTLGLLDPRSNQLS